MCGKKKTHENGIIADQLNTEEIDCRLDRLRFKRDIPGHTLSILRSSITVAWVEHPRYSLTTDNISRMHAFLENDHYSVLFYLNIRECIKYLKQTRSRQYVIVVIVCYPIDVIHQMIDHLRRYRIVQTIYIVTSEQNINDWFSSTRSDITVFDNKNALLHRLELRLNDIFNANFEGGLFTTFYQKERALKDIRGEMGKFLWNDLLRRSIFHMSCDSMDAKEEMLAECRSYYRNDHVQLRAVEEFGREYKSSDAIRWYTKPGFLFYLVNKALRSGDIMAFYTFRYFIRDLYNALKSAAVLQSKKSFRLYRGTKLHLEEVENLSVGCIVTINTFFSCSRDRRVAEMFIIIDPSTGETTHHYKDESLQYVLFEIDVDLTKMSEVILADVGAQSELPDENEMIFTLGSTFILQKIAYDSNKCIWIIQMSSFYDTAWKKHEYEQYLQQRLECIPPTFWFGNTVACFQSNHVYSLHYWHRLLRTLPFDHKDRPIIYYTLGRRYRFLEKYDKALICFRSAQLLLRRLLPEKMFEYSRVLSGTGIIYMKLGNLQLALRLLGDVTILQSKHFSKYHIEIPFHWNHLANAYYEAKQYEKALVLLRKADDFFEKQMLIEHQGHIKTLHTMGLVYQALGEIEKAYSYFKKTLSKCESLFTMDHPKTASTYHQLSLIHEKRGKYETALKYARRALCIRFDKLPYYHSELKQARELVERLQLKQKTPDIN